MSADAAEVLVLDTPYEMATAGGATALRDGRAILLAAVRAALLKQPVLALLADDADWKATLSLARDNRLLLMAAQGLSASPPIRPPPEFTAAVERYRALTLRINGANLVAVRQAANVLTQANIDAVVVKGPTALHALYGDYFVRPSMDVDLLVSSADFERAGAEITKSGHAIADDCTSFWWRVFLGEQHFVREGGMPIDLHHRIQQPGCPSPASIATFVHEKAVARVGGGDIPVLSWRHACLLSCVSLVKGIVHLEASGSHACDIAAHVVSRSPEDIASLVVVARKLGLKRTLEAGLRAASVLFGVRADGIDLATVLPGMSDELLAEAVLNPVEARVRLPRRIRILWDLSDNVPAFVREVVWKFTAEVTRAVLHPGPAHGADRRG